MTHKRSFLNIVPGLLSAALFIAACAPLPPLIPADSPLPTPLPAATPGGLPSPTPWPPLEAARQALAQQLEIAPESITLVSSEPVEWPDACLDAAQPDEMCAQVITPGYKVVLEVDGVQYEFHTDETGAVVRGPIQPAAASGESLEWRGLTAEGCTQARFSTDDVTFGPCDGDLKSRSLEGLGNRANQLYAFVQTYRSFSASTPAGTVTLAGEGPFRASPADQRMLAEWAARVAAEAEDEQGLAMWGLGWHREGGIAGFCDDLAIDATGYVELAPCKYENPQEVNVRTLTADELAQFYGWLDTLAPFEFTQQDPATADALTVHYIFAGRGSQEATDADKQTLADFSREVLARWPGPIEVQTIQALADVTIYAGPGLQYSIVGQMLAGQTVLDTGILADQSWWRIMCPDETFGNCWVSADPLLTQPVEQ